MDFIYHAPTGSKAAVSGPSATRAPDGNRNRFGGFLAGCLIVAAGVAAYANSFSGAFVLDDVGSIGANPSIHQLTALSRILSPPRDGETVSGRPVLNLSLAISYATGGDKQTWDYHATNLAIHLLNALLVWAILRRTFQLPVLRPQMGDAGAILAWSIALLWTVHPLQTESVTYIVQRAESLASLFYLTSLYGVLRGSQSNRPALWYLVAVVSCWLGVATKEIVMTAPVVVLLYDRTFLSGSFCEALRRRWGVYAGLMASWLLLAILVGSTGLLTRRKEMGTPDVWSYALSQPGVILYYLRLSLWPHPLCLEYGWPVARTLGSILPATLAVGSLATATIWGLCRGRKWGFLGAWVFLLLAPTSSVVPLRQLIFEHRMYLALAGIIASVVIGVYLAGRSLCRRSGLTANAGILLGVMATTLVAVAFGLLTARRNDAYGSELSIWQDTLRKSPHCALVHYNVGACLSRLRRWPEAMEYYQDALQIDPRFVPAHNNLGQILANNGHWREALDHYRVAIEIDPDDYFVHNNMAMALARSGRPDEAVDHHQIAARLRPDDPLVRKNWGDTMVRLNRPAEAVQHYRDALRIAPRFVDALGSLAAALAGCGRVSEAAQCLQEVLRFRPESAQTCSDLGDLLVSAKRYSEANDYYRQALRLRPGFGEVCWKLSRSLAHMGDRREALEYGQQAVRMMRDQPEAARTVAWLLATNEPTEKGDRNQAVELAERACKLTERRDAECLDTLAIAYAAVGRFEDATSTAEEAYRLARSVGQKSLAEEIRARQLLYRERKPYRGSATTPVP